MERLESSSESRILIPDFEQNEKKVFSIENTNNYIKNVFDDTVNCISNHHINYEDKIKIIKNIIIPLISKDLKKMFKSDLIKMFENSLNLNGLLEKEIEKMKKSFTREVIQAIIDPEEISKSICEIYSENTDFWRFYLKTNYAQTSNIDNVFSALYKAKAIKWEKIFPVLERYQEEYPVSISEMVSRIRAKASDQIEKIGEEFGFRSVDSRSGESKKPIERIDMEINVYEPINGCYVVGAVGAIATLSLLVIGYGLGV